MENLTKPQLRDVAVLTRAVENVFRKLVRLLLGRISLKKLQEMLQVIFVEESEAKLRREDPGKNVSLSTLAVLTGFDTRTITKIKSEDTYLKPFYKTERFLSEITPECSVLDVWESHSKYTDPETGKPKVLKIKGPEQSFESLVGDSISTRGITARTFLQRLKVSKTIEVDEKKNEVRMIDKAYTPFDSSAQTEGVRVGMAAVGNLVETIIHNLNASVNNQKTFYQRGCWTHRLRSIDKEELREKVTRFLYAQDGKARDLLRPYEQEQVEPGQITAGISLFYFEEEPSN